jgi:hypothetical protein
VTEEKRKKVSVKIYESTRDFLEKNKNDLPRPRPDYADLIESALLRRNETVTSPPERQNDEWHRLLSVILRSGDSRIISAIQQNLSAFAHALELQRVFESEEKPRQRRGRA